MHLQPVDTVENITPEDFKNNYYNTGKPLIIKGLAKKWPAYKKYFMHGTSHHMGLDTHDYGILTEPMKANMVFTVEPGIYIPAEGFGIRLEDNIIVQESGEPFNMMRNIPIQADEIEELMNA